jgi:hypothetical protein
VLRGALGDDNREIRLAAIRALSGWPTPEPYPDLRSVAKGKGDVTERTLALRGCVRLLGLDSTRAPGETIIFYREAMTIALNDAERKRLLSAVGESRSPAGLAMAAEFIADTSLRAEAEAAVLNIAEALPDSARRAVVPQLRQICSSSTTAANAAKAAGLIRRVELYDDYITTWEIEGPYHRKWIQLLDEPFGPELFGASDQHWVPFRVTANPEKPWLLDIGKSVPGEDNLIYLRTHIWSPEGQGARIEAGSDAGMKMWLNGTLVHAVNVVRQAGPGDSRVPILLQKGWNVLMIKLEQGDGPWCACARVRASDGGRLEGIRVSATGQ